MGWMVRWLLVALGVTAIAVTVLALVPSNERWVRIWDFPRVQIAACLAFVLLLLPFVAFPRRRLKLVFAALLATALAWQVFNIWPYTPLAAPQAEAAADCPADSRIDLLVANVLIDNRESAPLFALVDEIDPDLILLLETDAWWDDQLRPLTDAYPHAILHPLENSYGIHLFSRFALIDPLVRYLIEEDVPSIKTGVLLPSGAQINLYGLHPKPPPLADTEERDAELLVVGKEVSDEIIPSIVAGDLNDVAWSQTNSLFQEVSGLLDPRLGRGLYPTFVAMMPLLRWPLDHVFFEESFTLLDLAVLDDIKSDHFPLFVALCHDPSAAARQQKPEAEPADREAADEAIEEGREAASD
jgi:endonuclease/exonuclease/phosphatase (EEP) superfamily protein YafD